MPPRLNLVSGPSGAGKTSFCRRQPDWEGRVLNLDQMAARQASLGMGGVEDPQARSAAWKTLLTETNQRMAEGQDPVCVDTVFSENDFEALAELAARHGYETALWVLAPSGPEICSRRVAQRRAEGGHGSAVYAAELYENALAAASAFGPQCDHTFLVDSDDRPQMIAWLEGFQTVEQYADPPQWAQEHFPAYEAQQVSRDSAAGGELRL